MFSRAVTRAISKFCGAALVLAAMVLVPLSAQAEPIKIAGIFETPIEEPWVKQIHDALLRAQEELGVDLPGLEIAGLVEEGNGNRHGQTLIRMSTPACMFSLLSASTVLGVGSLM